MELEELAKKEIKRMEDVLKTLKVVDNKGSELYEIMMSYFADSKGFLKRKDYIRAFETVVICWAYCDAGLHFGVFKTESRFGKLFTLG